jgi:SAM-dependent methyltransferase
MPTDAEIRRTFAHGPAGIAQVGHREYVGGLWDEVGRLQFRFLRSHGLRPEHRLLDVGCGSLRAGVHLVPYLDPGCYMGVDKEPELLRLGIERELDPAVFEVKRPVLLALPRFEFDRLPAAPDIAWANSLFTHLPLTDIRLCLANLRSVIAPGGIFYATFAECDEQADNPTEPHDHRLFEYTHGEMVEAGHATGWRVEHLGKWGHPRGQRMVKFIPNSLRQGGRTHED